MSQSAGAGQSHFVRPVTASSGEKNHKNTKPIWRGQFRLRLEVMPGETSGEVMRRKASAEVMPPSVGCNALKSVSGREARFAGKKIRCTLKNEYFLLMVIP